MKRIAPEAAGRGPSKAHGRRAHAIAGDRECYVSPRAGSASAKFWPASHPLGGTRIGWLRIGPECRGAVRSGVNPIYQHFAGHAVAIIPRIISFLEPFHLFWRTCWYSGPDGTFAGGSMPVGTGSAILSELQRRYLSKRHRPLDLCSGIE